MTRAIFLLFFATSAFAGWGEGSAAANNTVAYMNKIQVARSGTSMTPAAAMSVASLSLKTSTLCAWSSFICWPLKDSQNVGAGTSVLSLGGLGYNDGVMTNGPTWGASGVTFATGTSTGRDRHIRVAWDSAGAYDVRSNSTVVAVSNFGEQEAATFDQFLVSGGLTANGRYAGLNARDGTGTGNITCYGPTNTGNANFVTVGSQTLPAGTFRMWTTQRENNDAGNTNVQGNKLFRDATQLGNGSNSAPGGVGTIANASETLLIGTNRGNASTAPIGEISFVAVFSDWTINVPLLRQILQSTILSDQLP